MSPADPYRSLDKIVEDILDAATAAAEIVARGGDAWRADRLLRLAAEAVVNRIGDAASKLLGDVRSAMPHVKWDDIRANRVLVAHVNHRIDPAILWATITKDVPALASDLGQWQERQIRRGPERDTGLDIGL